MSSQSDQETVGAANADGAPPALSVVIPTYNRCGPVLRTLAALDHQTTTSPSGRSFDFEVIVVSDGSSDGTVEALERLDPGFPLTVVDQLNAGPSRARNAGVARATGDIVLFIDDDVVPEPECAGVHFDRHAVRDDVVVIGPMLTPPDHDMSPWVAWEQHQLEKWYPFFADHPEAAHHHFYTGNASLRRAAFVAAGGFDESLSRAEDVELAWRLHERGAHFEVALHARALHYAERSLQSWRSIAYEYGRTEVGFVERGDRDRQQLLREKYERMPAAQRGLVEWCARGARRVDVVAGGAERVGILASRIRFARAARAGLSAGYGIRFHAGVVDGLGPSRSLDQLLLAD